MYHQWEVGSGEFDEEIIQELRKYRADGYTVAQLLEHLQNRGVRGSMAFGSYLLTTFYFMGPCALYISSSRFAWHGSSSHFSNSDEFLEERIGKQIDETREHWEKDLE